MSELPELVSVNKQILVQEPDPKGGPSPPGHPTTIILFGWGDCQLKHLLKFRDGFAVLYPQARQVIVLGPISKAMHSDHALRTRDMRPVVDAAFLPGADHSQLRLLVHAMSNTGAVNYATALKAYRDLYRKPMPHTLLTLDSSPGGTVLSWDNLKRWSRAMTVGTANWFPWPFRVTQGLWAVFILLKLSWEIVTRQVGGAPWSKQLVMNKDFADKRTSRAYLYGRDDDLIAFQDIEEHMAASKEKGWAVEGEMFTGSGHVVHMRAHGERYWQVIKAAWEKALQRWQKQ